MTIHFTCSCPPLFLSLSLSLSGKKKIGDRKIYLFTDGSSDCSDDQLDDIMAGLKSHDIELIIM